MTIYQIGLLQVGFLCFIGLCIYALGKAVAPKRKPEPDRKAIASHFAAGYQDSLLGDYQKVSQALREYEEAAKHED